MNILGISAYYHDSAAALISDGKIIAASQEERFTRIKHDSSFPKQSISFCLNFSKISSSNIDYVVFYEKPFLKFERILETALAFAPKGFKSFSASMPIWVKEKLFQKPTLIRELNDLLGKSYNWKDKLLFNEHHLSHAASAFFPSPFHEAAILTLDGVGEWVTTSIAVGKGKDITMLKEINFPHSLGLLYSAFTYYLGFKVNSGEYKVMGLAPYGEPKYVSLIKDNLIHIKNDGSFRLNMKYFDYCTNLKMTNSNFDHLFNGPPRNPEAEITQKEMDIACSLQKVTEEVILKICQHIKLKTKLKNLCLAGGVALNCVANGIIQKRQVFDNIWIQPAAGDAGGSIGAALAAYHIFLNNKREKPDFEDSMQGSYLGPEYTDKQIKKALDKLGAKYELKSMKDSIEYTAKKLSDGYAVGWMNGRMEFGPRSLGSRSILADPRSSKTQKLLNLKVKYRESFRPFAPSILAEDVHNWFNISCPSPYMLLVAKINEKKMKKMTKEETKLFGIDKLNIVRSEVPAVTHVDYSARVQTVHKETNKNFYELIKSFKKLTGCPILVNTSFNIRGEPIVSSPADAFKCFMGTELDLLIINGFVLEKSNQNQLLKQDYKEKFELD